MARPSVSGQPIAPLPRRIEVRELSTPRARLRPLRLDDDQALLEVYGDVEAVRYLGRPPATLEELQQRLARMAEEVERGEGAYWTLTDPGADRALGFLGYFRWDPPHRTAELGYMLHRSRWGMGLMGEILPPVVRYGFQELGLHRMEARIDPENAASIRLAHRLGFREEGRLRERTLHPDGSWTDLAIFGLLDHEFTRG
jgi:ribosomal-protein-alanine N-acetyltransferase